MIFLLRLPSFAEPIYILSLLLFSDPTLYPIAMLLDPAKLVFNALLPITVLRSPVVLAVNASLPIAVLSEPVVFNDV